MHRLYKLIPRNDIRLLTYHWSKQNSSSCLSPEGMEDSVDSKLVLSVRCEDDDQKETVESNLFISVNTSFGFCDEITFLFLGRSYNLWHIWALYIKLLMRSCRES